MFGVFNCFGIIQGFPEMLDAASLHYPTQRERVNSISSGWFNGAMGLGQIIAFGYGPIADDLVGF